LVSNRQVEVWEDPGGGKEDREVGEKDREVGKEDREEDQKEDQSVHHRVWRFP
jgi:hypothetical protein